MITRNDPWRFIKPKHGELAFVQAIDKVRHLLTDQDRELLFHHSVEGVDSRGRIILRQSPQLSRSLDGRSKAINLISPRPRQQRLGYRHHSQVFGAPRNPF